jgi:hypothetical protein
LIPATHQQEGLQRDVGQEIARASSDFGPDLAVDNGRNGNITRPTGMTNTKANANANTRSSNLARSRRQNGADSKDTCILQDRRGL